MSPTPPGAPRATAFPFDALLFDLDGTLVATERFWPDAAREACLEAFPRLGITAAIPPASVWMDMVGHSLDVAFPRAFPDLEPRVRDELMAACVEHEARVLARGSVSLLPGVERTLTDLAAAGVRLGIASNCGRDYLEHMLHRVGLARWIEEARCVASPGVRDKSDMIEDLLATFDTRSAVMVGDRVGDRDAAWANGVPHVHIDRGYAAVPERFSAEAILAGMDQLVPRLREREAWLDGLLRDYEPSPGSVIGVTGRPLAGKSLVGRDLVRRLSAQGVDAALVSLEDYERPAPRAAHPGDGIERCLGDRYDDLALAAQVLEPHRRGKSVTLRGQSARAATGDTVLVLEGPFLAHPDMRERIDHLVHLVVSDEVTLRRAAGRDGRARGVGAIDAVRRELLPLHVAFEHRYSPRSTADVVVIADNPLGQG